MYNLSQSGNTDRSFVNFGNALQGAVEIISEAYKRDGNISGLPTGFIDLDKKLSDKTEIVYPSIHKINKLNKIKVERIIKKNITVSSLLKMRLNIFLKCSII